MKGMKMRRRKEPIIDILLEEGIIGLSICLYVIFLVSVAVFMAMTLTLFACFPFAIVAMANGNIQEVMQFMNTFLWNGAVMLLSGASLMLITKRYMFEEEMIEGSIT